jgi:hypothetical protein
MKCKKGDIVYSGALGLLVGVAGVHLNRHVAAVQSLRSF